MYIDEETKEYYIDLFNLLKDKKAVKEMIIFGICLIAVIAMCFCFVP